MSLLVQRRLKTRPISCRKTRQTCHQENPRQIRALLHVADARMGAINGCLHLHMRTIIASDLLVLLLPGSLRAPLLALPPELPVSERPPIDGGDLASVFKGDPLD